MPYPKHSDHALARTATAALLFFSFSLTRGEASVTRGEAAPQPGLCSGLLTKSAGEFVIAEEPEHICIFSGEDKRKIFAICAEGHYCEVAGILNGCKDAGECSELTNVVSVRDLTLVQRQEQPPSPDAPPPSTDGLHREGFRDQILAEVRSCVRGALESSLYAGLNADRAMTIATQVCGLQVEILSGDMGTTEAEARQLFKDILEAEAGQTRNKLSTADITGPAAELRGQIENVTKACGSPVSVLNDFSRYLQDSNYRFIALHFEKIRCADLTAICRTKGCLHQIYVSKSDGPYQLVVSAYLSEIELKRLDNGVALEITSSDGTRLLRWNGGGFH